MVVSGGGSGGGSSLKRVGKLGRDYGWVINSVWRRCDGIRRDEYGPN